MTKSNKIIKLQELLITWLTDGSFRPDSIKPFVQEAAKKLNRDNKVELLIATELYNVDEKPITDLLLAYIKLLNNDPEAYVLLKKLNIYEGD